MSEASELSAGPVERGLGELVKTVALFAVLGPLVGTGLIVVGTAVSNVLTGLGGPSLAKAMNAAVVAPFLFLIGIPFGYWLGVGPAAAAGVVVGILRAFSAPRTLTYLLAVCAGAVTPPLVLEFWARPSTSGESGIALFAATGAAAALVCTWAARRAGAAQAT